MQNIKRRYDRFFIMFKQELSGYSLDGREPNGYCKIEIRDGKGKANTYIQNLKPLKDGNMYRIYIISAQGDKSLGIPIGWLDIDNKGRGECKWEFNPDNLDGTGLAIEDFNVVAIIVKGNNAKELVSPIVGYKDKELLWKNGFRDFSVYNENIQNKETVHNEQKKEIRYQEPIHEIKEETYQQPIFEVKEDEVKIEPIDISQNNTIAETTSDLDDNDENSNPHKIFNNMVNKFYAEMEELEKYKILNTEDIKMLDLELKEIEIDDISYMFENNETIKPFERANKSIQWIKIAPFELVTLNLPTWTYIKHQFINASWKKYKHLILGKYSENDNCKYILGVPDTYDEKYVNIATELGFKKFVCCRGRIFRKGDQGYWIMEL